MRLIDETTRNGLPCTVLSPEQIKTLTSPLAQRIVTHLIAHPGMHAAQLAEELHEHEQKVYYHIRKLTKAGILTAAHRDTRGGIMKSLHVVSPAFAVLFGELQSTAIKPIDTTLEPFVANGTWNATIVVSSPDPHGPESARGRDVRFAVDIAMFFGTHLTSPPDTPLVLDTELRDWDQNLIIIGGPVVNKAAEKLNAHSPVPYDREQKCFTSRKTQTTYGQQNVGVIARMPNPFAQGKEILLIAGKRYAGTQAAMLAFVQQHARIMQRDTTVVLGMDKNSDGSIDSAEMLE